ncbi:MAG TPA: nucleoside triphosphate pyrophosphohydrolase [Longimicrobiaceae bacterium]|nr:nucleoside triphosphate pyrophosphohydrolase [Longimicrobiaceae bacterium]
MNASQAESPAPPPPGVALDRALALVEFLRAHCPWDAAQTPRSLRRYLLEEAHEVVDAIDADDGALLCDELGDLLLNLAFQVVIGEEAGRFTREQVVRGLEEKMRRRHPQLYGLGEARSWEALKASERGSAAAGAGLLSELQPSADPLRHAHRIQERVAAVGFDWPDARGAWEKVREEVEEVGAELPDSGSPALEEEVGDLLFALVNLARLSGVDAPTALARANTKFSRRFGALERLARERGVVVGEAELAILDGLWDEVKRGER